MLNFFHQIEFRACSLPRSDYACGMTGDDPKEKMMLKTSVIIGDGIKLGKHMREKRQGCVNRKIISRIVAMKCRVYGVDTSDEFTRAIDLYADGVAIGNNGWEF